MMKLHLVWKRFARVGLSLLFGLGVLACSAVAQSEESATPRELNLPATPFNYTDVDWPPHFASAMERFDNTPEDNPLTDHGATLGRVLFYDTTLSANGTTSCASCHKQSLAFTDDEPLSTGFDGKKVARNSMSLVNVRFYQRGRFFWDERARTLEQQVLMPIENPIEMGHELNALVAQLQADPIYPPLFDNAFGSGEVTQDRISKALAQFVRSIVSFGSRYDEGLAAAGSYRRDFPNFTEQENLGKDVFLRRANCASCHMSNALPFNPHRPDEPYDSRRRPARQVAFFTMTTPAVNGVDADSDEVDLGVGVISGSKDDRGRFKSPSLRNVELTGPFMHDGRFHTLDQVVEHYNWSIKPHPNLDGRLQNFAANGMGLPEVPKVALVAFLKTLTDRSILSEEKWSDPFVHREGVSRDATTR
ncbi:cytochrome-c peroxidase [Rhodopirellula sp. JC740]|uniref:Cytochrome-c peroxidase n=1 Tax=Rhodopirellula halodulae TaxID=2894198 RepID=A0ABS8NBU3_9BACT|nr:cytochrome c peroxidase [Rhodopirellula sp. JC740]MCC9640983.1 cytochrome-c peroxidase [Rhodopirellula sp. JC740]